MHLLATQPGQIEDGSEAVDLGQTAGDILFLSAADTELAAVSDALAVSTDLPNLRLANLMVLKHNLSVYVYCEAMVANAKLVIVRMSERANLHSETAWFPVGVNWHRLKSVGSDGFVDVVFIASLVLSPSLSSSICQHVHFCPHEMNISPPQTP